MGLAGWMSGRGERVIPVRSGLSVAVALQPGGIRLTGESVIGVVVHALIVAGARGNKKPVGGGRYFAQYRDRFVKLSVGHSFPSIVQGEDDS
jgi:hypothetical protein